MKYLCNSPDKLLPKWRRRGHKMSKPGAFDAPGFSAFDYAAMREGARTDPSRRRRTALR